LVDGESTLTKHEDLANYIIQYYSKLYMVEPHLDHISAIQNVCWDSVLVKVTNLMNKDLTKAFILEEVMSTITRMPKGKPPGKDELPMDFFQKLKKLEKPKHLSLKYLHLMCNCHHSFSS